MATNQNQTSCEETRKYSSMLLARADVMETIYQNIARVCYSWLHSGVSSQHVLTEGYLTIYTDGSYVLCRWQVAP